jgi:hypothetical protein
VEKIENYTRNEWRRCEGLLVDEVFTDKTISSLETTIDDAIVATTTNGDLLHSFRV